MKQGPGSEGLSESPAVSSGYPEPGHLVSLGATVDVLDAEAMIAVLRAAAGVLKRHGKSRAMHMAREALWDCWEQPRLPRPLFSQKYPFAWPWSVDARRAREGNGGKRPPGGYRLVIEHVAPRGLLVAMLIDRAAELSPADFTQMVSTHLSGAIITSQEDRVLNAAGVGQRFPDGADPSLQPWCRYEAAGIDLTEFAPL